MPRRKAEDPPVAISFRLPASVVAEIDRRAAIKGVSRGTWLRAQLTQAVKPSRD